MKKVITYGSFDLFHQGHYNLLKRAKELGDYLIVGITTEHYDEDRGKLNIVDSIVDRIENVKKTGFADLIILEDHVGQKIEDIQKYGISVFTVGSDWEGKFDYIKPYCEVVYLPRTKDISSTQIRNAKNAITRIGIIGTGRIAGRFVPESRFVSGILATGVYNPHIESAKNFAQTHQLDFATDNLDEFFDQIDAVYVASPHEFHYSYTKNALEHGKNVLCEKPLCFSKKEAEELFEIARSKNLVLLEAIKTAYCPGFNQLLGIARSGVIGEIYDVEACFTRLTPAGKREVEDTKYGGSFTEFGSYSLLPIIKLMGKDYKEIRFESVNAKNGIDLYTKAFFKYENGFAMTKNGLGVKSEGQLIISGEKGYILVPSPWWLTQYFEVRYEDSSKIERYSTKYLSSGLRYEISDFVHLINGSKQLIYKLSAGESIVIAQIMEEFIEKRKIR
ncbi:MAG: Gfo/Idh/MocA family oxidoreductase [Treponemataceae bacterium]